MELLRYKFEWTILLVAVFFAALSVHCDLQSMEATSWFGRSGSLIVLLSLIVEFRLSPFVYDDVHEATKNNTRKSGVKISNNPIVEANIQAWRTVKPKPPKARKALTVCSHIMVILGTIIWGYGDLWIN